MRVEPYWSLEPRAERARDEEWLERVRETVGAAVRRRLVADVPLGALLSGGIDSSIVVAEMAQASSGRCARSRSASATTATTSAPTRGRSPSGTAPSTRRSCVEPDVDGARCRGSRAAFDEPLGDEAALPQFVVCELARRHVTVALTGDGGDEAFAGYERYAARRARRPRRAARARARRRARCAGPAGGEPRSTREPRGPAARGRPRCRAATRYGRLMEVFPAALRARAVGAGVRRASPRRRGSCSARRRRPGIAGLQRLDVRTYLPGDLLLKADIASMAHSLELRSPLLDHEVLELGVSLPDSLKVEGRRGQGGAAPRVRRRAPAARSPARGKTGFGVPIARWFRGELRDARGRRAARRARPRARPAPAGGGRAAARRARLRPRRPRPPALVPAHARALAARRTSTPPAAPRSRVTRRAWLIVALVAARPAARRAPPRARRHPRRVHREERRLRADVRPTRARSASSRASRRRGRSRSTRSS